VQYLERIAFLGPDVVAAHCIWVDYTDMKILADHQVGCVHNPSSNMMLASGVAPSWMSAPPVCAWASARTARQAATTTWT